MKKEGVELEQKKRLVNLEIQQYDLCTKIKRKEKMKSFKRSEQSINDCGTISVCMIVIING